MFQEIFNSGILFAIARLKIVGNYDSMTEWLLLIPHAAIELHPLCLSVSLSVSLFLSVCLSLSLSLSLSFFPHCRLGVLEVPISRIGCVRKIIISYRHVQKKRKEKIALCDIAKIKNHKFLFYLKMRPHMKIFQPIGDLSYVMDTLRNIFS